jgi:hypothetical protein
MEIGTALLAETLDLTSHMKPKITSIFTSDSMDSSSSKLSRVDDSLCSHFLSISLEWSPSDGFFSVINLLKTKQNMYHEHFEHF